MKLLVVDDSVAVWERLFAMLGERPAAEHITQVTSLAEARALLKRFVPDFVVLDAKLPDGNGVELLAELKAAGDPKVAVFSNHPEYRERFLKQGADWFFDKSMDFPELLALLRHAAQQEGEAA